MPHLLKGLWDVELKWTTDLLFVQPVLCNLRESERMQISMLVAKAEFRAREDSSDLASIVNSGQNYSPRELGHVVEKTDGSVIFEERMIFPNLSVHRSNSVFQSSLGVAIGDCLVDQICQVFKVAGCYFLEMFKHVSIFFLVRFWHSFICFYPKSQLN